MTWLEILPVGGIMCVGVFVISFGLSASHRAFHYGKPHRLIRDPIDFALDERDESIFKSRAAKKD